MLRQVKSIKSLIVLACLTAMPVYGDVTVGNVVQSGQGNSLVIGNQALSSDFVTGSGKRKELQKKLRHFDAIQTYLSAEINISQGKEFRIRITADDNILPLVKFNIEDGTLKLYSEKSFSSKNPLVIDLSLASLKKLLANGSGTIRMSGLHGDRLNLELNGSGDISGSGTISHLNVLLQGSGDMDLKQLKSKNCDIELNGSGDISVYADQALDAKISGAGDISVAGHPAKVKKTINGSGEISFQ